MTVTTTRMPTCCGSCRGHSPSCGYTKPRTPPSCKCTLSNRRGQGCRGFRLRWPRPDNRRRAVLCKSPSPTKSPPLAGKISNARFVHISNWDIELHNSLIGSSCPPVRNVSLLGVPISWNPCELKTADRALLEYFCCVASASLPTFGHDGTTLGNMLVRIAMQEVQGVRKTGVMTSAVLQALLAFSSLHRYGLQSQALELKDAALRSLAEGLAAAPDPDENTTMQHTAAGMLLCSFEVHQACCTSDQWTFYLGSVKTVLHAYSSVESLCQLGQSSEDVAMLLDWVQYFDVLARFSLLHSKREQVLSSELPSLSLTDLCAQTSRLPPPISSMLNLFSDVCDTLSSWSTTVLSATQDGHVEDFKGFLALLEWRIRSLPISKVSLDEDVRSVMQLYQLAVLIYLNRSVESSFETNSVRMQGHIDKAFELLAQLRFGCKPQFPIYVIGCEAQTDEQRAIILDVISQTEEMSSSRSWNYCKRILEATWAQDDLANGNHNTSYRERLSSVLSQCLIIPSFV